MRWRWLGSSGELDCEALNQNFTWPEPRLCQRTDLGGKTYSAATLEGWYYDWRHQDSPRCTVKCADKGTRKALSPRSRGAHRGA